MQSVIPDARIQEVRTRLLEEIKATKKRIHLRLMDKYPKMTVKEVLYLIECRIEGEKFVISSYRRSVQMLQEQYDNRDNLERLQFLVWEAGKIQWED